jgi:hypothetical protein
LVECRAGHLPPRTARTLESNNDPIHHAATPSVYWLVD